MASRILLADDSITIQKVVNLTFADEGIEVIAVSNGDVAERRLAEIGPDLVLADIFMPGKNGYELCEAIKESSQFRNVPVVLLVGAFEPFDQAEARRVKADAHLTKPFESRTLVETVRRLISASWRSTTGPIAMPAAPESFDESASADSDITQFVSAFEPSALVDGVVQSAPDARNTGELASPSPDVHEVFDLGLGDAPAVTPVSATLTDTSERFEPLEFSPNGDFSPVEVTPSFALDSSEGHSTSEGGSHEIQEPHHIISAQDSLPFENVQPSALHEVNISGAGEGEHWISAGSFETARLDHPSDGAYRGSNGSAVTYPSADFTVQTEVLHGASEAAGETACATLLAVDEPLGDVLFGETAVMGSLAPLEVTNGDALGLELGEPEVAKAEPAMPTHFDLVEIVESAEVEAPAAEPTHVETTTTEARPAELPAVVAAKSEPLAAEASLAEPVALEASVEETPTASEQVTTEAEHHHAVEAVEQVPEPQAAISENTTEPVAASQPSETQPVSAEIVSDSDWTTPNAASYSTAQLEPVVMSIDTAEQVAPSSVGEGAPQPERVEEASFTAPATWHEEEAHFTPIDVEPAAAEVSSVESSAAPTVSEPQLATPDQPDVATAAQSAEGPAGTPAVTALSSAAIEEIVRRVVTEMSESVVREVAWEVVPDCVERVIEQLTRESLSKRA